MSAPHPAVLDYPLPVPPAPGSAVPVTPDILWLRMPLPCALDHINLWLLAEADGFTLIDCGYGDAISLVIAESVAASGLFADESIDWVHLDARHDYESVKSDIAAWLPKVKPGGWLSGDDYDELKFPELVRAVGELLPKASPWSTAQWRWIVG